MQPQPRIPSALKRLMKEYLDCLVKMNQPLHPEDCSVVQRRILELTELLN